MLKLSDPVDSAVHRESSSIPRAAIIAASLAALAAAATWGLMSFVHPWFKVPAEYGFGMSPPPEAVLAWQAVQRKVDLRNAMIVFGIGGALLGTAVSGVPFQAIRVPAGLLGGAACGIAVGCISVPMMAAIMPKNRIASLAETAGAQAIVFGLLGLGIGALAGLLRKSPRDTLQSAVGGLLAGSAGAFLSGVIAGIALPGQSTLDLIPPQGAVRALWLGIPFPLIAFVVISAAERRTPVVAPQAGAHVTSGIR